MPEATRSRRGAHGAAGPPAARALPRTGPADVARRLRAVGAGGARGAFVRAAADGWWEWPERLGEPEVRRMRAAGAAVAVGRDRTLVAGARADLAGCPAVPPRLARWLGQTDAPEPPRDAPPPLACGGAILEFGWKTYVVAIVNRTPDSFSDGTGSLPGAGATVARCWAAFRAGADVVDVGAESTEERERGTLSPAGEVERLLPVLRALGDLPAVVSLDTRRAAVAEAALRERPVVLNDVDALADPGLAAAARSARVPVVLMRSAPLPPGGAAPEAAAAQLEAALARAVRLGLDPRQVVLDAGFGFGTADVDQDLAVTRGLGALRRLGRPLLHAPSRKAAIGRVLGFPEDIAPRLPGTAAAVAIGIAAGADLVRVHDVEAMARVARMTDALVRGPAWRLLAAP